GAPMDLGDHAQVDGEGQVHQVALAQPEIAGLDEHPVGTEIERTAQLAWSTGDGDEDSGTGLVAGMEASLHLLGSSARGDRDYAVRDGGLRSLISPRPRWLGHSVCRSGSAWPASLDDRRASSSRVQSIMGGGVYP